MSERLSKADDAYYYGDLAESGKEQIAQRTAEPEQAARESAYSDAREQFNKWRSNAIRTPEECFERGFDEAWSAASEQIESAVAQRTAELEKRVEELERILKNFYLRSTPYWTMRNENSK